MTHTMALTACLFGLLVAPALAQDLPVPEGARMADPSPDTPSNAPWFILSSDFSCRPSPTSPAELAIGDDRDKVAYHLQVLANKGGAPVIVLFSEGQPNGQTQTGQFLRGKTRCEVVAKQMRAYLNSLK
jgi:hypothetical protein